MKKQLVALTATLAICATTVGYGANAMASNISGYERVKQGFVNFQTLKKNGTFNVDLSIEYDGQDIRNIHTDIFVESKNKISSETTFTSGTESRSLETYVSDESFVAKKSDDDTYYTRTLTKTKQNNENDRKECYNSDLPQLILDTLMGDAKNQFVTQGDQISLNLSQEQVPQILQLMVEGGGDGSHFRKGNSFGFDFGSELQSLPNVKENVKIQGIVMTATLDNEIITDFDIDVTVIGEDDTNQMHTAIFHLQANVSDLGNTTAETVDVSGKKTETLPEQSNEKRHFGSSSAPWSR